MNLALTLNKTSLKPIDMKKLFKPISKTIHHAIDNIRSHNSDYNTLTHKHNKVLKFDKIFKLYLDDIEKITNRPLNPIQHEKLKYHIDNFEYRKLSPKESKLHRKEFNDKRKQIIIDWEQMTGEKWPTYDKPVYSESGKMIRQAGSRYDAHEIIQSSWGSPHHGWNVHPCKHPSEHQNGVHRKGGYADRIFN